MLFMPSGECVPGARQGDEVHEYLVAVRSVEVGVRAGSKSFSHLGQVRIGCDPMVARLHDFADG